MKSFQLLRFVGFISLIFIGCWKHATPETYLIPEGYQGNILIVFDQPFGQNEEIIGGRRVYHIDSNGILITKFKNEDGFIDQQFYYQLKNGLRKKIEIDKLIFTQDTTVKKTKSLDKNYDSVLVRSFGISGLYGGSVDFKNQVSYTQSTIASEKFMRTSAPDFLNTKQWNIIKLKIESK